MSFRSEDLLRLLPTHVRTTHTHTHAGTHTHTHHTKHHTRIYNTNTYHRHNFSSSTKAFLRPQARTQSYKYQLLFFACSSAYPHPYCEWRCPSFKRWFAIPRWCTRRRFDARSSVLSSVASFRSRRSASALVSPNVLSFVAIKFNWLINNIPNSGTYSIYFQ